MASLPAGSKITGDKLTLPIGGGLSITVNFSGGKEGGGWKSAEMVRRYAHLAPAQMAKHADVVGSLLYGTNTAQGQK
jgi:hypothetical protein